MATFNKPIITTQGLAMLKSELSGSAPLAFTKVIFTSDDYSQLSDTDVVNLTDVKAKDITAQAQTFVSTDGTTKVRATADNRSSNQAFHIKGYALYAKQNGNETLFAVAVSDTSDYVPAFNNKQLSQVSYTFQFAISETDNITLSDVHDIPVSQADIKGVTTYVDSKASKLTDTINQTAQSTLSSANAYTDRAVADKATHEEVNKVKNDLQASIDTKANKTDVDSAISEANSNIATKADKADVDSAVKNINANIGNTKNDIQNLSDNSYRSRGALPDWINNLDDLMKMPDSIYLSWNHNNNPIIFPNEGEVWGVITKQAYSVTFHGTLTNNFYVAMNYGGNWHWTKLGG